MPLYLFQLFILGLGIADSDDEEEDTTDLMDDDDAIFLPEKSANARRLQPLIPDDFGLFHLLSFHFLIVFQRNCLWLYTAKIRSNETVTK